MSEENKNIPPATSVDVVKDEVSPKIKKLETRIATLEDTNKTLQEQNKTMMDQIAKLVNIPSQSNPSKSLWDELNDFCFKPLPKPNVPPEKKD